MPGCNAARSGGWHDRPRRGAGRRRQRRPGDIRPARAAGGRGLALRRPRRARPPALPSPHRHVRPPPPAPAAGRLWCTGRERDGVSLGTYAEIPGAEGFAEAITRSLAIAGLTVVIALVLMVPTVVLVDLRLPRLRAAGGRLAPLPPGPPPGAPA